MLYSWTSRLNYIVYNLMTLLACCGLINHVTNRWGHHIGLREVAMGLS